MYLSKCWRETRSTFFVFVGAILAVGAFAGYVAWDPFGWIAAKPLELRAVWQSTTGGMVATMLGMVPMAGFVLGALGVGMEFEKGTADFLLTRPRSRRYFLWTSWSIGAAQMAALVLVSHAVQLTRLDPHHFGSLRGFSRSLAAFCTVALFFYTVTYLMTTLARNSRHGTALSVTAIVGYFGLYTWLRLWYEIAIPMPMELMTRSGRGASAFPIAAVAGWLTVCLALMLIAQFRFERAEA